MTAAGAGSAGEWERLFPAAARPAPALLTLTAAQADAIRSAAAAAYPHEGCGLLAGVEEEEEEGVAGRVTRVVAAANVAPRAHDRFEIDPRAHLDLMKALRGTAERLLGHWHSHPDHPPTPSATDLAQAWEPGLVWIICAVTAAGPGDLAAWRLTGEGDERRFEPVVLRIDG
ncbi:M67 family metallopeptidase [Caenispirillum bisanense]|uniref:M67 family metallopeptidase n=1 Tax=Caenispirillum bisanense TaxID=414052 RepID=UPI0031D1F8BC